MVPRPPPHPRLGKNNCHEANKINKKHLFDDSHVFLSKELENHIKLSQNVPRAPPPHPRLGKTKLPRGKNK